MIFPSRPLRRVHLVLTLLAATLAMHGPSAAEDVTLGGPGKQAALLMFPYFAYDSEDGLDSILRLTNLANEPVDVSCVLVGKPSRCTITGNDCSSDADCFSNNCERQHTEAYSIDFPVRLLPGQPLDWSASTGLSRADLPVAVGRCEGDSTVICFSDSTCVAAGLEGCGPTNAGTAIPPVPEDPFQGFVVCVAVDEEGRPTENNALRGSLTLVRSTADGDDTASYRAIGYPALAGANNGDRTLVLGGPTAEYAGCARELSGPVLFDFALEPISRTTTLFTKMALIDCNMDFVSSSSELREASIGGISEFFLGYGASSTFRTQLVSYLSERFEGEPDDGAPLSVAWQGTLGGKIRVGFGGGIAGVAVEEHHLEFGRIVASSVVELTPTRFGPASVIRLPGAATPAPMSSVGPTATPTPTATPRSFGPEITYFGLATASGRVLEPASQVDGLPLFEVPRGYGFRIVIEARAGRSAQSPGTLLPRPPVTGGASLTPPHIQLQADSDLGDGNPEVCEFVDPNNPRAPIGGVPGIAPVSFEFEPGISQTLNDFACRLSRFSLGSCVVDTQGAPSRVAEETTAQVCSWMPVDEDIEFPIGDTTLSVRWLDVDGNPGEVAQIVVRVAIP